MAKEYPKICPGAGLILAWQLKGKKVLLVGGGIVAAGRLVNVKDADAILTVLAPRSGLCSEMKYRIFDEKVVDNYIDRTFGGEEDLDGYDMVLTAIDDAELSRSICQMARARRIPINVADVPPECDFYFGSLVRRGPLQVMISTGGKGPRIAAQTKEVIERSLPPYIERAIENVGILRAMLRKRVPEQSKGKKRMSWMIDVCETWSWKDLADMTEDDMLKVLEGYEKGKAEKPLKVQGVRRRLPTRDSIYKFWFSTCPVVGSVSPWLGGVGGFALGVATTWAIFTARSASR